MFGTLNVFEVGGAVRDSIMGLHTKDIDFSVEAPSFGHMRSELEQLGFEIFVEDPQFVTLRARFPKTDEWNTWLKSHGWSAGMTCDFVLCRKDSASSDNRRPDFVEPGTLFDDLARRDFTVNAIARSAEGALIDPHNGMGDIATKTLRFVGDPFQRVREDGLRVLRGLRFMVTKDLTPSPHTEGMLHSALARHAVRSQEKERIFEELKKMFAFDTIRSLQIIREFHMESTLFDGDLWLIPTLKPRR